MLTYFSHKPLHVNAYPAVYNLFDETFLGSLHFLPLIPASGL